MITNDFLTRLNNHKAIGWDFDDTLYGNRQAALFHQYILDNPQKRHFIVTFRTHGHENPAVISRQLGQYRGAPDLSHFEGILSVPYQTWADWNNATIKRLEGFLRGPLTPVEQAYGLWKGAACKAHKLTVLVDDDPVSEPGCLKAGVEFISSI